LTFISYSPIPFLVFTLTICLVACQSEVRTITSQQVNNLLAQGDNSKVILDVRTADEVQYGSVPTSIHLDFFSPDFQSGLEKLDRDQAFIVYCQSGVRSEKTANQMVEMGFQEVYEMSGGFKEWKSAGYELTKD